VRRAIEFALVALFAVTPVTMLACDEPLYCYEGEYRACLCEDGARGYQQCIGEAHGACVCDGTTPGLTTAGSGGGGGAGGGALLPFMAECEENEQCETGLCYFFNAKGKFCSKPCMTPDDCPPPSPGCNGMGICKAP
jgi:hypothetical protein